MNPDIAIQMLSDMVNISGVALSIYFAIVLFALSDKDLFNVLSNFYRIKRIFVITPFLFLVNIFISFSVMISIDSSNLVNFDEFLIAALSFGLSLVFQVITFLLLMFEKFLASKKGQK